MILVRDIQRAVAKHYKLPVEKLVEPALIGTGRIGRNSHDYAHPRQVAMCLANRLTEHSRARIGHFFGGRDPTTVRHAAMTAAQRDKQALRILTLELLRRPII